MSFTEPVTSKDECYFEVTGGTIVLQGYVPMDIESLRSFLVVTLRLQDGITVVSESQAVETGSTLSPRIEITPLGLVCVPFHMVKDVNVFLRKSKIEAIAKQAFFDSLSVYFSAELGDRCKPYMTEFHGRIATKEVRKVAHG